MEKVILVNEDVVHGNVQDSFYDDDDNGDLNISINAAKPPPRTLWQSLRRFAFTAVLFSAVGLVFFASGQSVSFKKLGYKMGPYPYFIVLFVAAAFVPIFFGAVWWVHVFGKGITPESTSRRFKMHFIIMGFMNAVNGALFIFSVPHTSGTLQNILNQLVLPYTMICSVVFLKIRYTKIQYLGCFIVVVGIIISLIPTFEGLKTDTTPPFWIVMFMLSSVPVATSQVYQEFQFSQAKLSVSYMMAWSNLSQLFFLILFAPMNFIPDFGGLKPSEFFHNMRDAGLCLANQLPGHPECHDAWVIMMFCVLTMVMMNLCQTLLVKYGSATLCVIIQPVVTPVSTVAFTFKFLMGKDAETMTVYTWISLAVLTIGIVIYRVVDMRVAEKRKRMELQERMPLLSDSLIDSEGNMISEGEYLEGNRIGIEYARDVLQEANDDTIQPLLRSIALDVSHSSFDSGR